MKYLCCAILIFCSGCRLSDQIMTATIMSWNVQNIFDGIDDGNEYPEFDPGSGKWNERLYIRRLDRIGSVITQVSPDILVLQELEKAKILDDLSGGPLKGRGYHYALAVDGMNIIRCGILSRYPIANVRVVEIGFWRSYPLRPVLSFSVHLPGEILKIIAVHWKSPRGGREWTEGARYHEATILHNMVTVMLKHNPGQKILIIGDFNTPGDGQFLPAALAPPDVKQAALHRTPIAAFSYDDDSRILLFDPEPSSGPPGTYYYQNNWDRPDRALLSPSFLSGQGWQFQDCRIPDYPELLNAFGEPNRWQTYKEEGYSDHLPLIIELKNPLPGS